MAGKNTAVSGIYSSGEHAEYAVDTLIAAGFASRDISVLLPDTRSTKEFAPVKETKAPEGTAAGVITGGVVSGTLDVLAGIGVLARPGVGPFIALSVHCDTGAQISRAKDLLKSSGAEDIASTGENAAAESPKARASVR